MATFTQEEYDDQARIERGYDQLLTTLVPFSMDPAYSSISHMVCFRDRVVGATPRDGGYRIIDGIEKVKDGTVPRDLSPKDILEKISGGKFKGIELQDAAELLSHLELQAAQSRDQSAILFVKGIGDSNVMFGIALKGREFYLLRKVNVLRQEKWERQNCELVSTPTGSEFADQTIAVSLSQELKKIGPYNEKKKLEVMVKIFGRKTPLELNYVQVEKEQ